MKTMKTIRWGIIGCGAVTEVKSGPALQKASGSTLVAVMRRTGELAKDYAHRHNVPKWYEKADDLINDPDVNAVYIATPPSSHMEYTLKSAQAHKPVYVEKPMALNYKQCKKMIDACKQAEVPLFVAYYRRALPRFLKVKEIIENGEIGKVRFVTITLYQKPAEDGLDNNKLPWRVIPEIAGGGKFADLASHTLDLLDYIFGPITGVKGNAANQAGLYKAEDIVTASLVFESGIYGTGVWSFSCFENYDMNIITGSKGKISFPTFDQAPIKLVNSHGTFEYSVENPVNIQQPLIQTVVDQLNCKGSCPSTGISASRTNWVMDQLLHDYYKT